MDIYTDGAVSNNGYRGAVGGWAFAIIKDDTVIFSRSGSCRNNPTNQTMELRAIIESLKKAEDIIDLFEEKIYVYSDSAYCVNCYLQQWWKNWEKNGWKNAKKQPVANRQLWELLIPYFKNNNIIFCKVKGHSNNPFNNLVDQLAVAAKGGTYV